MALTRLDNLISSKTGKYLYVSPDDFNASDELNNRGNSPIRPFKSLQRAFIEISRYSYQPGPDNDRFDQFTVMVMPGKHYVDNRPGLVSTDGIDAFTFDQAMGEWADSSNLDISDPNNKLYLFNNTEGGAIIPRGSSIIGYDLRRTSVHPLFVPDPADMLEQRSAIFNVTGGCYFWQFTIRDGDLEPSSPLYDSGDGVGKVYYQNGKWDELAVPNFSHHKLTVFEYADKEELSLYYQKVAKAFSQYQPTIDDPREFGDRIEETRIVGPLSDIRAIESIKCTDLTGIDAGKIEVEVTSKVNHGYFKNQFIAIESNGLDEQLDGTFAINSIDLVDKRKFVYQIPGTVASLGTVTNLSSGTTYTTSNGLNANAVVKAEVDSVESASPYVFNCSIRSTWGICGIWANGLKATGFKSMVIAQYTGVSLQKDDRAFIRYDEFTNTFNQASLTDAFATVPYHTKGDAYWKDDWRNFHVRASEDAFIQCVSIFAVGFADHFLMESGGDMSITNSNSNFGNTSLHAKGHKGYSFNQDKGGYITDIVPPKTVTEVGKIKRQSYYTLDVYASNDQGNHTRIYHGDDQAYDPTKRPAATINGYRIGAKNDDELKVKLSPVSPGSTNLFSAKLNPSGFKKFTAAADVLNPSGVTINNKTLDAADLIEANKEFIAHESYDRILAKYPALKVKETITIEKCRRDVGYLIDATVQDLRLGGNVNTIQAAESYYVGNNLSYINDELIETLEGYNYARDLAIAAMRNFTYLRTGVETINGSALVNIGDTSGVVEGMTVADYDPSMFTDGKLNSNAQRPTSPIIPNNTFVKRVVDSTTIELGDNTQTAEKKFVSGRYGDARALILNNKDFIAAEAQDRVLLDYPGYTYYTGTNPDTGNPYTTAEAKAKCIKDIKQSIDAIADNVGYGGNAETWDVAYLYESGAVLDLANKKEETLTALNYARDMAVQVMRKEKVFVYGTHGLAQDYTTSNDPVATDQPELVNDRNGDARNLILANKNLIANESVERMILTSSTQQFTPDNNTTYNAQTGELTIGSVGHNMTAATSHTVTDATYTASDGKLVLKVPGNTFTEGQRILIKDNSLSLKCAMDSNTAIKTYPRATDPVSGKWLTISHVHNSAGTFEVNVGKSPLKYFTPTAANYNPTTGLMTLTIGNHGLKAGTSIRLLEESLKFSCGFNGATGTAAEKSYPRASDPFHDTAINIESVTVDTITLQVLATQPSTNVDAHTFVEALANAVITGGDYVHQYDDADADGILAESDSVRIDYNALTFTCGMDSDRSEHQYPRLGDPAANSVLPLVSKTNDAFTVNVGKSLAVSHDVSNAAYNTATGDLDLTINDHNLKVGQSIRIGTESLDFSCDPGTGVATKSYPRADVTTHTVTAGTGVVDVTDATYDAATGVMVLTIGAGHGLDVGDQVKIAGNSLSFTCAMDGGTSTKTYPRPTDPIWDTTTPITAKDATTITINVGQSPLVNHQVSFADYDPSTGDMELTIGVNHGLTVGESIRLADNAITFSCLAAVGEHKYVGGTVPNGVTINGTPETFYDADYEPTTGILTVNIGSHAYSVGSTVQFSAGAVKFTCDADNHATQHDYPRATDPANNPVTITSVTADAFTVNVGIASSNNQSSYPRATGANTTSGKDYAYQNALPITKVLGQKITVNVNGGQGAISIGSAHTYVTAAADAVVSGGNYAHTWAGGTATGAVIPGGTAELTYYDPNTGNLTLYVENHGFEVDDLIKIVDESLTFKCGFGGATGAAAAKAYPRVTDPISNKYIEITGVTPNTFTVQVLDTIPSTNIDLHEFVSATPNGIVRRVDRAYQNALEITKVSSSFYTSTGATYDPATGDLVVTVPNHGIANGQRIKIAPDSLTFRCEMDGKATEHTYPRTSDPKFGKWLSVSDVETNTFKVNVESAGANKTFSPGTASTYDPSSGDLVLDIGSDHGLTTGESVVIDNGAISFTCTMDGNKTSMSYPRAGKDKASGRSLKIKSISDTTITVNVGSAGTNKFFKPTAADYTQTNGDLLLTVGQHGMRVGDKVVLKNNSLKFTCAKDSDATEHTYPRLGTDPWAEKSIAITQVGSTSHTITNADYSSATGKIVLTVPGNTFVEGDYIKIADDSLKFTCDLGAAPKSYPRAGFDHPSGRWLRISNVDSTAKTFEINVGLSSHTGAHVFSSADPNGLARQDGTFKINVGFDGSASNQYAHTFVSALDGAVEFLPESPHTFAGFVADSIKFLPQSAHEWVRSSTNGIEKQNGIITVNVGASSPAHQFAHTFVNADPGAITSGGQYAHDFKRADKNSVHKTFSIAGNRTYHKQDCVDDVNDLLEAIADNVAYGGNDKTWDAAYSYKTGAHVAGEERETNRVFEHAKQMAAQVIKNQKILAIGSHGIPQTYNSSITEDIDDATPNANGDAFNLIHANIDLIANEAYERMILNNPGFLPPTGNPQDCVDDIKDFVTEIAYNVAFGGNDRVWDMANLYVTGAHVAGEEKQTLAAFTDATELMIQAMRKEKILIIGSHGKTQDYTTARDPITVGAANPINNKVADAFTLITTNKNFIAEVALGRMTTQYPGYTWQSGYTSVDCLDDLKDVVDVVAHNLRYGGNDRVWDAANMYVAGAHAAGSENETVYAFNQVRDIIKEVATNVTVTVGNITPTADQQKDTTITDGVTTGECATALSAVDTLITILTNTITTPSSLVDVPRSAATFRCTEVESTINTLSTIAKNAITDPVSLAGAKEEVSTASYNEGSGELTLTVGDHDHKVGEVVHIPSGSVVFKCTKDSGATEHAYPRVTDPISSTPPTITAVTGTTITVNVGAADASDQYPHTFVRIDEQIQVGGVARTRSDGRCNDVRGTIDTLFNIVKKTITTPSSLDAVTRTLSNGPCQNVASAATTLFGIITGTIQNVNYLDNIERTDSPTGLSTGNAVNSNSSSTNTYLYFTLTSGRYTSNYNPSPDDTITQSQTYPQCASVASAVRQYFSNITTIIQTGLNTVPRTQPSATSDLSQRATVWTLDNWTPGTLTGSNPHNLETGTPVRLVPRPRYDKSTNKYVEVDKRNVRLPNGFSPNEIYYVIAPGRVTKPENYGTQTAFNGTQTRKLMLASSETNAAAGIYIHSAEVEAIHPDVEIDVYQFVLDGKYDLHQYSCELTSSVSGGIQTDVPHIFDVQNATVTPHKVFFRANIGGSLPEVGGANAGATGIVVDSNSRILGTKFFYARYINAKVITVHKTRAGAINNTDLIEFVPLQNQAKYNFSIFADKRESPMKYDPAYQNPGTTPPIFGKWYLQVQDESTPNTQEYRADSILKRFHDSTYNDQSGNNKTNDSWFERIDDDRTADDRIYRFRYVIPKYLKSVRDPLNGFTIKMRKDNTRKLLPQKLKLKQVSGTVTKAKFYNTTDSGNSNEIIGYTDAEFNSNSIQKQNAAGENIFYDPYKKDTKGTKNYTRTIETTNYVSMDVQSGRYYTEGSDEYLELTVFNHGITNVGLKNEIFTTVKITKPQGDNFIADKTGYAGTYVANSAVTWDGNSEGSGYIHAVLPTNPNDLDNTEWHLILKGVTGSIDYSATDNIRFSQGKAFADLQSYTDYGKSLQLKTLIKEGLPQYYYRQNGAKVYTATPGDIITDADNKQFYIESVEDVGEIDDTFYIFSVEEIQRRIFDQQDGIFYITALRGNVSPYPQGAGNQKNFHDFKFSQPVSKLYPLNYKNDPVWFKQIDENLVDPPATYSAADNYIHGLVTVNDFKGSTTKESVVDFLKTEALKNNTYTDVSGPKDNTIQAQDGNASSGAEDRRIPIAGDNTVVVDQRLYVELRRPSIARAGNHTFEYLGFGPGNYSTGFPARQEVLLSSLQDFYSQSKKQDGGLVFYTGLNSNGDLYIGNRKIDAITGEEEFLERASLVDSDDEDDTVGSLVTTFDTAVTFNEYITVNGGEAQDKTSTFNSPVTINVPATVRDGTLGVPGVGTLTSLKVTSLVSNTKDDGSLDRTAMTKNRQTNGDIIIAGNRITAGVFQWNQRGSDGTGQGYKIQTHIAGSAGIASNITPDQDATYSNDQIVAYGAAGGPRTGDMLLKGKEVGGSGSIGWILANQFSDVESKIEKFVYNNNNTVIVQLKTGILNDNVITGGISAGMEVKINNHTDTEVNGTWQINAGFVSAGSTFTITLDPASSPQGETSWASQPAAATIEIASSDWKEWGVLGAQSFRTDTKKIGEFKVGINTVARSAHDAYINAFVSAETDPRANLDVVGNAFISGKSIRSYATNTTTTKVETSEDNAFLVGGASATPNNTSTFRVSTTGYTGQQPATAGRVGVNAALSEMVSAFTVVGTSEFTDDAIFQEDVAINGGGAGSTKAADITTEIDTGTVNLFMTGTFKGLTTGTRPTQGLKVAGDAQNIELGNITTGIQNIKIGNTSTDSQITIGATVDGTGANASRNIIGGAYASDETKSVTQIDTKVLSVAGDIRFGQTIDPNSGSVITPALRGAGSVVNFDSSSETFNFLSGNTVTSVLNFGLNASDITIGSQGGTTQIRNNLTVDATSTFNSTLKLCGGYANYSFTGYRAQSGSSLKAHTKSTGTSPVRTVDIINVLAYAPNIGDGRYNRFDEAGNGDWGNASWSNAITTGIPTGDPTLPALPAGEFYLPLKYKPVDQNGDLWFAVNDILLMDTVEQSNRHSEFVKITGLPRVASSPYWISVTRQPFGDLNTTLPLQNSNDGHEDETAIYKCTVQYDATWLVEDIGATGTEADVYLSQFGGSLIGRESRQAPTKQNAQGQTVANPQFVHANAPGDYVILTRDDSTNPDTGEIVELKTTLVETAKKFIVRNGCSGAADEEDKFVVDSVTGKVTIIGDQEITGSLTVNGKCATPYVDDLSNRKLTINNGAGITTFEVDTCTGNTTIGNNHGVVFMMAEQFGSSPAAYTKGVDTVYAYRHDPLSIQATGPKATIQSAVDPADSNIEISGNHTSFETGDLVLIYIYDTAQTAGKIEVIRVTDAPFEGTGANAGKYYLPTSTNSTYSSGGRGVEGTTAQTWTAGSNVVVITEEGTTKLMRDIPATRDDRKNDATLKARSPNTSDIRLEIPLDNADIVSPKLDYVTLIRIGSEWFLPDSVHGGGVWDPAAGLDPSGAVKMPKNFRNPNTSNTTSIQLYNGGKTNIYDDVTLYGGALRMYGSDGKTPVAWIANDDGHAGDGSVYDPVMGSAGLTVKGEGNLYGDLRVYYETCIGTGLCSKDTTFKVDAASGSIDMGFQFYQEGKLRDTASDSEVIFHVDNLGSAGTNTAGPKDFKIYQSNAIDSFGIEKYWTANGGRRYTYVAFDATTGIGQQQTNPLQVNNNYLINSSSGSNMVLYLPDDAQTGDMIRFTELSGNLTYNTSLVIRALKVNNTAVAIQGDASGSTIAAGSGTTDPLWESGELIIQTRNASFGLLYVGQVDLLGSTSSQTIPASLRGWWLQEL